MLETTITPYQTEARSDGPLRHSGEKHRIDPKALSPTMACGHNHKHRASRPLLPQPLYGVLRRNGAHQLPGWPPLRAGAPSPGHDPSKADGLCFWC
eukprot:CAMPEP_0115322902 /NCGR_PEP_ID=MMETSP0270-20121206/81647_1 /TAXON_ID=71861 /ORGANISM="Scrippsiella trochoidea, Strain CCMP3099" /LENGTH=95 /DNA_ID=CAMNT_0002742893 /DNA_START=53 /DNA_END=337 /DNA_ORIENTATION=-